MNPAQLAGRRTNSDWPSILLTTLIGTAQGLFLVVLLLDVFRAPPENFVIFCYGISLALAACGLAAAFFGLGRSGRAWRAATQCCSPWMLAIFFLLGTASGLTLSVPLAVLAWPQFAGPLALGAFALGALAWLARIAALVRGARLRPTSAVAAAVDGAHPGERTLRAARWTFLVLLFPVPGWLLGWGGGSFGAFAAAFALQFAGLLAERWHFFAEARLAQNFRLQAGPHPDGGVID